MGKYRELNWKRTIKLSTAPYVNPALMKNVGIAYRYDPDAIAKSGSAEQFFEALETGVISVAELNDAGDYYQVISFEQAKANELAWMQGQTAWGEWLSVGAVTGKFCILGAKDGMYGVKAKEPFVSWNAYSRLDTMTPGN